MAIVVARTYIDRGIWGFTLVGYRVKPLVPQEADNILAFLNYIRELVLTLFE